MGKKINKKKGLIVLILFAIILILGIYLFGNLIDYVSVLEKQEIYTKVIVAGNIGFDINNSALIFGAVMPGGSSSRELNITNNHNQNVQIEVYSKGDIKDFLSISDNDFRLRIGESRKVDFSVSIPFDAEYGTYEGEVIVVVRNVVVK